MSSASAGPPPVDVFGAFVRELALFPQGPDMLDRLRKGHAPGRHGWCSHPAHAHRWELYPCTILRLADLVEGLDVRDRPAEPGRSG